MSSWPMFRRQALGFAVLVAIGAGLLPSSSKAQVFPATGPFQNLATLHVKPSELDRFLVAMRANAADARAADGNIAFNVYAPVTGEATIYVLEQWRDHTAYEIHLKRPALLAMHQVASSALDGKISSLLLVAAMPGSGVKPKPGLSPAATVTILSVFTAKPHQRDSVIKQVTPLLAGLRKAPGNISVDLYKSISEPDVFVQVQRWTDAASYDASLKRPAVAKMKMDYSQALAKPMEDATVAVKDITTP